MQIRSQLHDVASGIQSAMASWDGGERIHIKQTEITITKLASDTLNILNQYLQPNVEQSLKGRMITLQTLSAAVA